MTNHKNPKRIPARRPSGSTISAACDRLVQMTKVLGPGAQMPAIRQLQAELGVSISTVGLALAELERREIIRRRQGSGIFVASRALNRRILLICNPRDLDSFSFSPFWRQLMEEARQCAESRQVSLSIQFMRLDTRLTDNVEAEEGFTDGSVQDIANGRVHGVLAVGLPHGAARWIEAQQVPVVAFAGPANYILGFDMDEMIEAGVAALVTAGCRRIALLNPLLPFALDTGGGPHDAFMKAARKHHVEIVPNEARSDREVASSATWAGYLRMEQLLALPPEEQPDGLLSGEDMVTFGALSAMLRCGILPGERFQVATHSVTGSPTLAGWQDRMIRMECHPATLIDSMLADLNTLIDGGEPQGYAPAAVNPLFPDYIPPEKVKTLHFDLLLPQDASRKATL